MESSQETSLGRGRAWRFWNFALQSKVWNCTNVSNSNYASIKTKDAIYNAMHDKCGDLQPKPPTKGGFSVDVLLFIYFYLCRNVKILFNIFNENMNSF
jgi:hypothetical protein